MEPEPWALVAFSCIHNCFSANLIDNYAVFRGGKIKGDWVGGQIPIRNVYIWAYIWGHGLSFKLSTPVVCLNCGEVHYHSFSNSAQTESIL